MGLSRLGGAGPSFDGAGTSVIMSGSSDLPDRLGPYVVEGLIVTSAFSRVFRARDEALGRQVALKVFHLTEARAARLPYSWADWRRRFIAEARILARIDHPNVVRVEGLDFLADHTPYMVMPWHVANLRVAIGRDTRDPKRLGRLPEAEHPRAVSPATARTILREASLGLAALHARNIVHRDLKPTNLLLTARQGGTVRLCDLGMAKLPSEVASSRGGVWIGTENYCAPEQREDASRVTDRADIYALGVLAYRLIAGRLPQGAFPPASELVAGLSGQWDKLVRDMMNPVAAGRPTAVQVAARLAAL